MGKTLLICSKSRWHPAIRREHALAKLAAADGTRVVFIERAADIRAARQAPLRWGGGLFRPQSRMESGVEIVSPSSIGPGHRSLALERVEEVLLSRILDATGGGSSVVLSMSPWHWPAVSRSGASRRVHDCADDWRALIPGSAVRIAGLERRIAAEADSVIIVNDGLAGLFPGAPTTIVPNGVDDALIGEAVRVPVASRRMVFVGTLSERVDLGLIGGLMEELPSWTLDLWGQCQFAGAGDGPSAELARLLERSNGRLRWRGVVERPRLASVLDEAAVLVIPLRAELAAGDLMKLYDYAARGRPIVSTGFQPRLGEDGPPGLLIADGAPAFAAAVVRAAEEPPEIQDRRRRWADARTWSARWPEWRHALFGAGVE